MEGGLTEFLKNLMFLRFTWRKKYEKNVNSTSGLRRGTSIRGKYGVILGHLESKISWKLTKLPETTPDF